MTSHMSETMRTRLDEISKSRVGDGSRTVGERHSGQLDARAARAPLRRTLGLSPEPADLA